MLVSAIVPVLNEAQNIAEVLSSIRQDYTDKELEIIVVDGGSNDATRQNILEGVDFLETAPGRARQMNAGAAIAKGELLVFIHADTRMQPGWREEVIHELSSPSVSGGTFQSTIMPEKGWLMKVINRTDFPAWWKLMYGDQVQFMRRSTFEKIGGFPDIPLMEDVEMSRALDKAGKLVRVRQRTFTSGRRFLENGPIRQYWMNLICMIRYLYLGASAEDIRRVYQSSREKCP